MHVDYSNIINSEENTTSTVYSAVPLFVSLDGLVVKEFVWKIFLSHVSNMLAKEHSAFRRNYLLDETVANA